MENIIELSFHKKKPAPVVSVEETQQDDLDVDFDQVTDMNTEKLMLHPAVIKNITDALKGKVILYPGFKYIHKPIQVMFMNRIPI